MGRGAFVNRDGGTAFGSFAAAKGVGATAVGHLAATNNPAIVNGATSIGAMSNYNGAGIYSTAIGAGPTVLGDPALYLTAPHSQGSYSIAIGGGDGADFTPAGGDTIELNGARATGFISTAIGTASQAIGGGSMALGLGSKATANDSTAFGEFSLANGEGSVAIGLFSQTDGKFSLAIGRHASALRAGAVAIGNGSVAREVNVVSVGATTIKRRIVNVAPGVGPNDAVNVAQWQAALSAATAAVQRLEARIAQLEGRAVAPVRAGN
jgi:autotransporter adhesin